MTRKHTVIAGIRCDGVSLQEAIDLCNMAIKKKEPFRIGMINARKISMAVASKQLKDILNSADLCGADGVSILVASRLLGDPISSGRVNGTDLMNGLLRLASEYQYRIFMIGAKEETLELCRREISLNHPSVVLCGTRHGYGLSPEFKDEIELISCSDPQIVLIGLPSPAKELLAQRLQESGVAAVIHGVGGSFDVLAKRIPRAPLWMQRFGLEWFYRLIQEPFKMAPRVLSENLFLIYLVLKQRLFNK